MTSADAYADLLAHLKHTTALGQVAGLLGWDQETQMPKGSADQRAEHMGAMERVLHALRTDARIGDWLAAIDPTDLDAVAQANLRVTRKSYERNKRIPADLATRIAKVTSKAQGIWAAAREAGEFADFKPVLCEVISLRRQEAAALSDGDNQNGDLYDALLEDYEPGMTGAVLDDLLGRLRAGLVDLRARIMASDVRIPALRGTFSDDQQMLIARELASCFGYDWNRGRLDKAVHPFSSGSYNDVRITTRVAPGDPFNCFYSTIHEVGHAAYEQGVDAALGLMPIGQGASMGVHESQSRIMENQLGRSRAFTGYLYGRMCEVFGDFGIDSAQAFYGVVNRVHNGFIRTEADEVQYNLHVMLRVDLERALIAGDLGVDDLEAAWNDRFAADFGYPVDKVAHGVLQDVHWSVGLFGYFPTYSVGNIYAGELYRGLRAAVPDLDADLARGDTAAALAWLGRTIHTHGRMLEPADLMVKAVGHRPTEAPLLAYLNEKFSAIYAL
jgi:carboxypeptidase Taq